MKPQSHYLELRGEAGLYMLSNIYVVGTNPLFGVSCHRSFKAGIIIYRGIMTKTGRYLGQINSKSGVVDADRVQLSGA